MPPRWRKVPAGGGRWRDAPSTIERSHISTRDRLRSSRGPKTLPTDQRFFEGFEAVQALSHGHVSLERLVPGYPPTGATPHERARAIASAVTLLGARLRRAA